MNLDEATHFNPFVVVVLDNFNAKFYNWCIDDKTNFEGAKIDTLIPETGIYQIIKEPTQILDTSFSCTDLFLTSQPRLIMDSTAYASLHVNRNHQIVNAKINFQIYYPQLCGIINMETRNISEKLYAASIEKGYFEISI